MKKVLDLVAGARPNFMKLAPVQRAIAAYGALTPRIVHTGQHYDPAMNQVFFEELGIPEPDVHLDVGSGSHGAQTARIIERYEAHLLNSRPRATVVFGDVNSTVACALAAVKLEIPIVHVEAGLRSFDRSMPEEINRILTDQVSDLLFATHAFDKATLLREGVLPSKIKVVGNVDSPSGVTPPIGVDLFVGHNNMPTWIGDSSGNELVDGDRRQPLGRSYDGSTINLNLNQADQGEME